MDLDIGNVVDLATKISGLIEKAVSATRRLLRNAKGGGCPPELVEQVVGAALQVSEAQVEMAALQSRLEAVQRSVAADDAIQERKRNYVLSETPMGARVYRLKDDADTGEPPHEVCPDCSERDQIRVLQPQGPLLDCMSCKATFRMKKSSGAEIVRRQDDPRFSGLL